MSDSRTGIFIAAVVLIAIVIVVGLFLVQPPAPVPPPLNPPAVDKESSGTVEELPELSTEETKRLLTLHHQGIAFLENGEYDKSEPLLAELTKALPTNPTPWRNLAINQILMLGNAEIAASDTEKQAQWQRTEETISQLRKSEQHSILADYLEGKLAVLTGNITEAVEHFRQSADASKNNPAFWYAIYDAVKNKPTADLIPVGAESLKKAHELAPNNLWLICELLISQLDSKNLKLGETVQLAGQRFDFLKTGILKRTRLDIDQSFNAVQEALAKSDWPAASTQLRRVVNVVRPEVAVQIDRGKVSPHLLEFVAFDIGLSKQPLAEPGEPIAVKLVPEPIDGDALNIAGLTALKLIDFNLDGKLDVVASTEKGVHVLSRTGEANAWTSLINYDNPQPVSGIVVVDLDRDTSANTVADGVGCATADVDVIAFGAEGVQILLNEITGETRQLQPVEQNENVRQIRGVLAVAAVDFDHEGDLDLVISSDSGLSFWTNLGNLQFEKLEGRAGLPPGDFHATQIVPVDINRDITPDLFLRDDASNRSGRMINLRHGEFVWQGFDTSATTDDAKGERSTRALIADVSGGGALELLIGSSRGIDLYPSVDRSPSEVENRPTTRITDLAVNDLQLWDYDNDGPFDLVAGTDDGIKIWRGSRGAIFSPAIDLIEAELPLKNVRRLDVGDIDSDGDIDLAVATDERIQLFRNDGGNENHWLDVSLRAQATADRPQERVNIHGLGSILEVKIGDEYMTRIVTEPVTHFGLGRHEAVDVLGLLWPNGLPFSVIDPKVNVPICEEQRLLSSCAFLYAWNGERYDFITDLLWNAPLGLPIAEGVYIPPREWEYLHIPGERMLPRDGMYTLQVTEELWEAAYFDQIELIAVDHPAEVEIVSNEKVGPPAVAEYKLHTVGERHVPIKAVNQTGRDLLSELLNEDDRYAQPFDRRIKQGLVEEHFVELDLGELDSPKQIKLFLRGWMYPTGPSVNIAISQNPDIVPPRPPALSVPDANGEWKEVIPFTGFPGGKAKTIAIDLSRAFLTNDYRLRLSTNMEFYWDAAYFTVDEPAVELRESVLPMHSADLHFRGLSNMTLSPNHGPEHFDYHNAITEPFWSPMKGNFTRFGDVRELLTSTDDLLLVIGAGDEVTIRWQIPEQPLPPGWKRDFILHNVGWNKDDDLNTALGHLVEPLPYVGMPHYPYADEPERMQSPAYRQYLKTYQTRTQSGRFIGNRTMTPQ